MAILIIIVLLLVVISVVWKRLADNKLLKTVTQLNRGEKSERDLILQLLRNKVPANRIFHDVYIKQGNNYSQVDVIAVTEVGIVAFEVKDYSGWIFGKGYQDYWTQVLNYGKAKYRFYNPVKQNEGHIRALKAYMGQDIPFYSVIVFDGDCRLKDVANIPDDVRVCYAEHAIKVLKEIQQDNISYNYSNIDDTLFLLQQSMLLGEDLGVKQAHLQHAHQVQGIYQPPHNISRRGCLSYFFCFRRKRRY